MATYSEAPVAAIAARPESSLRSNFQWTVAGNFIYALCQWGMLSVLAKFGSASVVGQFALGLAITAPVFMLTNLQLRGVQATDARSTYSFAAYFTLRVLGSGAALAIVAGVLFAGQYDRITMLVVVLVALAKAVESLSDVVAGLLQAHERLDQVAIALMLKGVASVAMFSFVFARTHDLVMAVAAMGVTWAAVFAAYDLQRARAFVAGEPFFTFRSQPLVRLTLLSAPLGIVMALVSLNANVPRYIVEHYRGHAELGIFASLAYLVTAAGFVINALGQSAVVRLSRMFAERRYDAFVALLRKLLLLAAAIGVLGVTVAALCGRTLLTWLYRPEYAEHLSALVIMAATAGVIAAASFLGYAMTAVRAFKPQVPVLAAVLASTAAGSALLVPRFGISGAAVALLIGTIVDAGGAGVVVALTVHRAKAS